MKTGVELIVAERARQIQEEGWTSDHDDGHVDGELALAAACYASPELLYVMDDQAVQEIAFRDPWPWDTKWDRRPYHGNRLKSNFTATRAARLKMLVKAGALIAAEIDRLQRESVTALAPSAPPQETR